MTHGRADLACEHFELQFIKFCSENRLVDSKETQYTYSDIIQIEKLFLINYPEIAPYLLENVSNILFRLSNVHVDQFRTFHTKKI